MDWMRRALGVRAGEGEAALWSALCFFCVLGGWFVSRPVRDAMGTVEEERTLRWLFIATLVGMTALNPVFAWCVSRWRRSVFAPGAFLVFAANLWVFAGLIAEVRDGGGTVWSRFFYVWASVFNLFVVSVFWALMADLWGRETGKRLFGLIGVGGTLGALAGGATAAALASVIGVEGLLIIGGAMMAGAAACVVRLGMLFRARESLRSLDREDVVGGGEEKGDAAVRRGGALGGLTAIARSPALLGMSAYMVFLASTQTYVYFEQLRIVKAEFGADVSARTAAFGRLDVYVQGTTVLLQLFATGRLVRKLGIGGALTGLPVIVLGGAAALAVWPTFAALAAFQVVRRAGDYALARPAREAWYAGLTRMEKYKAKSFIDTFVYRGGDALGAWALGGVKASALGVWGALGLFAPICVAWGAVGLWVGTRKGSRARGKVAVEVVR